ncbi:tetratricopeptide repeat domain protein [Synechococcus sp. PCC 7335]|uniref:tetratricopeptide repeat protein n=1 Tax=Synechococcus sp. (strain ATCC 29403 / PCC 7335) TaxID=91464 RepID=UPI00017EE492|nr:tetratricopeptide repeat domain protein [Synechococcus sp. PCC 7335]
MNCGYSVLTNSEALVSLDTALEIDSNNIMAWNNRGHLLIVLGRYKEALDNLNKALEIDPGYSSAWHNQGENVRTG